MIEHGLCLDLSTEAGIEAVKQAYDAFSTIQSASQAAMPLNTGGPDRLRRKLDCAVIMVLHDIRKEQNQPPIDTVVGIFEEGEPLYANSGFRTKTHVQICVRQLACIRGVFGVPAGDDGSARRL